MAQIKSLFWFGLKVVAVLAGLAFILNLFGINLLSLISSPVATVKALFTPAKSS